MIPSFVRSPAAVSLLFLLAAVNTGCSSAPPRLYVLSSLATAPDDTRMAAQPGLVSTNFGSSQPPLVPGRKAPTIGVTVTVPEYLDRLDIVERTSANEVKTVSNAQWGESLAMTATHAVAGNLRVLLPSSDIVILPSRARRNVGYGVELDLARFETDASGNSILEGRWSITDSTENERASGRVMRSEKPQSPGADAMAVAMSRNLAAVSEEIAAALSNEFNKTSPSGVGSRKGSSTGRAKH